MKKSYLSSLECTHNAGIDGTTRKVCSKCGKVIEHGTLEYFMTTGVFNIWMTLHNRTVEFKRGNITSDLAEETKDLCEKLLDINFKYKMSKDECVLFMKHTYDILKKYNIGDDEASILVGSDFIEPKI